LSVGAVVAFTGIFIASLLGQGFPPPVALGLALLAGAGFGAFMGTLIHVFALPPFLVTLGGMFLARGMGFVVHPQSLSIDHAFYGRFVSQTLSIPVTDRLSIPFTATSLVLVVVAAIVLSRWTAFGR